MDEEIIKQILDELFTSLEPLETNSSALIQFLKAKGLATDEELAPFLEQAGNASSVRWRAARVRTAALISNALKSAEPAKETAPTNTAQSAPKDVEKEQEEKKKSGSDHDSEVTKGAANKETRPASGSSQKASKESAKETKSDDREPSQNQSTSKKETETANSAQNGEAAKKSIETTKENAAQASS